MNYRELLIKVIEGGNYKLADLESRIERLWLEGKLTTEERDELLPMAAEHAQDRMQVDVLAKLAEFERRIYDLEHPTDIYPEYQPGQLSERGVVYRYDVTGDGELDLVRYDGGRASTSLGIGKIEGWHMLDRELNITHIITRDADGGYVLTPIEPEQMDMTPPDYDSMTKHELYEWAEARGITVYESWTKADIVAAIQAALGEGESTEATDAE